MDSSSPVMTDSERRAGGVESGRHEGVVVQRVARQQLLRPGDVRVRTRAPSDASTTATTPPTSARRCRSRRRTTRAPADNQEKSCCRVARLTPCAPLAQCALIISGVFLPAR
jgi:hypothetical protein